MIDNSTFGKRVAVIGGGPAGMMAAGTACEYGADVTIFEQTDRLGKKLAITGKGRCNVTNNCSVNDFMENVTRNPRFLYTALYAFPPEKTIEFFEELGVELKTERGNRVFPADDKAKTIVDAMRKYASGAKIIYERVSAIENHEDGSFTAKQIGLAKITLTSSHDGQVAECIVIVKSGEAKTVKLPNKNKAEGSKTPFTWFYTKEDKVSTSGSEPVMDNGVIRFGFTWKEDNPEKQRNLYLRYQPDVQGDVFYKVTLYIYSDTNTFTV